MYNRMIKFLEQHALFTLHNLVSDLNIVQIMPFFNQYRKQLITVVFLLECVQSSGKLLTLLTRRFSLKSSNIVASMAQSNSGSFVILLRLSNFYYILSCVPSAVSHVELLKGPYLALPFVAFSVLELSGLNRFVINCMDV